MWHHNALHRHASFQALGDINHINIQGEWSDGHSFFCEKPHINRYSVL